MSNINRKKTLCKHNWPKIQNLLENKLYRNVINEIENIDTLTDLWYVLEAYLGLGNVDKAEELLNSWKYKISNPMSDSYWIFYEALIKIKNNFLEDAQNDLKKALEIATSENDEKIKKKILFYMEN